MIRTLAFATLALLAPNLFAQSLVVPPHAGVINAAGQTFVVQYTPGADSGTFDFTLAASPAANLTITAVAASIPNGVSSCDVTASSVSCLAQAASPSVDLGAGTITVTYSAAGNAGTIALAFANAEFYDQNGNPEPGTATAGSLTLPKGNQAAFSVAATPPSIVFGAGSVLASSGGSGTGAVSYAVTSGGTVCSLAGTALSAIGVGTCTITATKAGDANYNATSATTTVTVGKANQAALAVTATPSTIIFGNTSALASNGGSGTGTVTYAVTAGATVCSISGASLSGIGVGTCTITATRAADAHYNVATATTNVTVNNVPSAQSLVIPSQSGAINVAGQTFVINYSPGGDSGAFNFVLAATPAANLTIGSAAASIANGTPTCSVTAASVTCSVVATTPGVNLGAGAITVTYVGGANAGAIALNFSSASFFGQGGGSGPGTSTNGSLTLLKANQAALSATAVPSSIVFGASSSLGTSGGSGSGAVSFAVTSGAAACSVAGNSLSAIGVGSCTVTATKAGDANYNAATATVVVTVGKANQAAFSATATPASVILGHTSALASSGGSGTGAVTYAVTSGAAQCTISASNLSAIGVGNCTVTASKAADANYNAATATVPVTVTPVPTAQSLVVPPQTGVVNAAGQTFVVNYTPGADSGAFDFVLAASPAAGMSITAVSASIPNSSTSCARTPSTVTCVSTANMPSLDLGPGTITVTYTGGASAATVALNFTGASFFAQTGNTEPGTTTNGTLTLPRMDQAALAVIATPTSIVYGAGSVLTTSGGSGTGAVSYALTSGAGVCSLSGASLNAIGVGTCTVTANKAADAAYNAASASTTITVGKAEQATLNATATPSTINLGAVSNLASSGGSGSGAVSWALSSGAAYCALSGSNVTAIGVGSCVLQATRTADAHYNAATASTTVTVANTLPSVAAPLTALTLEDLAGAPIAVTLADAETSAAALQLTATSSNQALLSDAALAAGWSGAGPNRSLVVTPMPNANGSANVTLTVTDAHGGSSSSAVLVSVTAVNDAPAFSLAGSFMTAPGASGAQLRPNFVASTLLGPADEQLAQLVQSYAVSESVDPDNVVNAITLAADGTLWFDLSGAIGTAQFSAVLIDTGGTANGGIASSAPQLFSITVPLATDLEVSLGNGVHQFLTGDSVHYELIVANAGPTAVTGAHLINQLPAGLGSVSWVCNPVALASCPQSAGTGGIDQLVDLAVGGALHYTMNATVTAAAGATVLNTASISVPAGFLDIETNDNTVTDNDPVVPDVILDDDFEGGSRVSVMLPAGATRD